MVSFFRRIKVISIEGEWETYFELNIYFENIFTVNSHEFRPGFLECGAQATGGNHSDWEDVPNFEKLGFPIAEVSNDGKMLITKVRNHDDLSLCFEMKCKGQG